MRPKTLSFSVGARSDGGGWALKVPYYFCLVNVASLHGIVDVARGKTYTTWATVRA